MSLPDLDAPLRLADAARMFGLKVATLRTEKRKGRLEVSRVAGKDFTTVSAIHRMFERCRETPREPGCGSALPAETKAEKSPKPLIGSSSTADAKLALDAALLSAKRLKSGSPNTSPANTSRKGGNVHFLKPGPRT
ncbi:MAG: hypothetical protein ABSD90_09420 [Methylocystis sp.]|jgi:hypothetical protein